MRAVYRTTTSLRFATLRGHMEAGEIDFSAGCDDRGFLRFQIESWARSDRLFMLLYDVPMGHAMQLRFHDRSLARLQGMPADAM